MEKILVFGHRNPDVDSICSCIAYAELRRLQGFGNYMAARCGNSNSRIDKILKKFGYTLPLFIGDVRIRAKDIMREDFPFLNETDSCYSAIENFEKYEMRTLPILDSQGKLLGEISGFEMGELFISRTKEMRKTRHLRATLRGVIDTLKAEVHCVFRADDLEDFYVRVGAMDISSFGSFIQKENLPPEKNIVVVGDRLDIQAKAIQMGVRCVIISGAFEADSSIIEMAVNRGVSLVSCPYDSATTALMVRMATRASQVMRKDPVVVSQEQMISQIAKRIKNFSERSIYVCDKHGKLLGLFPSAELLNPPKAKIALVDHNELSQAVLGAEEADILEIIDHHRIKSLNTAEPILFINKPLGSTCTIVSQMFEKSGISPSENLAGMLLSGIVCDTLNLKSPTSTREDAIEAKKLSQIAGISADEIAEIAFSSDSGIAAKSPEEIISSDCKIYEENSQSFSVSQMEDLDYSAFFKRADDIRAALENFRRQNALLFSALLVTNVTLQDSILIACGNDEFISRINFARNPEKNFFELPKIVSRKKQLIPHITSLLKE